MFVSPQPNIIVRPAYAVFRQLGFTQHQLAGVLAVEALSLAVSLMSQSRSVRASVSAISALFWIGWGSVLLIGAWRIEILNASGLFGVACGFFCLNAVSQWAYVDARHGK